MYYFVVLTWWYSPDLVFGSSFIANWNNAMFLYLCWKFSKCLSLLLMQLDLGSQKKNSCTTNLILWTIVYMKTPLSSQKRLTGLTISVLCKYCNHELTVNAMRCKSSEVLHYISCKGMCGNKGYRNNTCATMYAFNAAAYRHQKSIFILQGNSFFILWSV